MTANPPHKTARPYLHILKGEPKLKRTIVKIDEEKCNGCGACAAACQEGAIAMIDGKAKLIRDDYCDGLGNCLPACPADAISFEEREAAAYDHEAVLAHMAARKAASLMPTEAPAPKPEFTGCPGTMSRTITHPSAPASNSAAIPGHSASVSMESRLSQWPVQIKLAPVRAPYFDGAKLLIAADCTAYAYGNFHNDFIDGHVTLIGCPKLDSVDYSEKLTEIIRNNDIQSVTVVRMEVPCCGGIEAAVKNALMASGKFIPWQVYTIGTDGRILK